MVSEWLPPPLEPEPEPAVPEPEPELAERHRYAVAVGSSGKSISTGLMRGAVAVGSTARAGSEWVRSHTEAKDSGPVSADTQEIVKLGQEVSEDLLGMCMPNYSPPP